MRVSTRIIALAAKLDLGRKIGECGIGACSPMSSSKPSVYYPTIWIDDQAKPIDLPTQGKAVVNYKVISKTSRERDGQTKHDATIEIQSIEPMDDEKKKPAKAGAAVPIKMSALTPGMISFARERNTDGEFAPQTASGADRSAMAKTYGPGAIRNSFMGGAAVGVGGTTAAALLARKLRGRLRK